MTAVEWYKKAIFEMLKHKENLSDEMFLQNMLNVHLRAKEMEKQQIKKAFDSGHLATWNETPEQYYNETFKKRR
jgi:hypothetical protein